jgi:hemimethylated DNA binding protein
VARLTRDAFRAAASLDSSAARDAALDRGFDALRQLNDVYTPALALRAAARDEHADRNGVLYSVGTTFRHKVFGYTGVVVGWDKTCARTPAWVEAFTTGLTKGADQPFYSVLPDARDCLALFGAVRESKYVAQVSPRQSACRLHTADCTQPIARSGLVDCADELIDAPSWFAGEH